MRNDAERRTPLFSVVTITFNNVAGLRRVAASVSAQTFIDYEWIVVDGGSTDGSIAFLTALDHPRLRFVSEQDEGIYNAMNKGIARSHGEYLIFMNGGDMFASDDELARAAIDVSDRPDLLYGDAIEFDGRAAFYKRARSSHLAWYSMFTHHQAIYYAARVFAECRYDESFRLAGDWALTLDVVRRFRDIRRVNRAICRFERDGASFAADRSIADGEAYRVYRHHSGLAAPLAWLAYTLKTSVNKLRFRFPTLYDRLRMRKPGQ